MLRATVLLFAGAVLSHGALTVSKVEPPNWWVRHTRNPIQLLLTGTELRDAAVSTAARGFRTQVRAVSSNGHYLFAYVTIESSVRAGKYRFDVKGPAGSAAFDFALDAPLD